MNSITVYAHVRSVRSLLALDQALTSAIGSGFTLVLPVPDAIADETQALAEYFDIDATLIPDSNPAAHAELLNNGKSVLLLPECQPIALFGLAAALELLDGTPDSSSVSGIIWDASGRATSNGYVAQFLAVHEAPLLVGLEKSDEPWLKHGQFAFAQVLAPTGFSVVKANHVSAEMCVRLSAFGRAVTQWSLEPESSLSSSLLFSGLNVLVDDSAVYPPLAIGAIEPLPETVFDAWTQQGIAEMRALHTGLAVRDDDQRLVLCVGDPMVRAIDGNAIVEPAHPSSMLLSPSYVRQLGPGFETAMMLGGRRAVVPSRPSAHRGTYEDQVVHLARRVDALLPHRIREWARSLLFR